MLSGLDLSGLEFLYELDLDPCHDNMFIITQFICFMHHIFVCRLRFDASNFMRLLNLNDWQDMSFTLKS